MAPSTTAENDYSSSPVDVKHPHLVLRPATIPERHHTWTINKTSWKGVLSDNAYYLREAHLSAQDLTRNGGIVYWVLVDPREPCDPECPQSPDHILSACETIRKPSLIIRKDGQVEEVICYGIGSVYTAERHRGQGYARTMLQLLGHKLKTLADPSDPTSKVRVGFSVLYSDIGKKFYARVGWHPHNSSHISIPTKLPTSYSGSTKAKNIFKGDLKALCAADCSYIVNKLLKSSFAPDVKARCVQLPTVEIMDWQHAREEFVGQYATSKAPIAKGAWASIKSDTEYPPKEGTEGLDAVWVIWTHDFSENKLVFLRLHVPPITTENKGAVHEALREVVVSATQEASAWDFKEMISWNADDATVSAVESIFGKESEGGYDVVHREMDSIASLMWYDREGGSEEVEPQGIEWIVNEKFAWC